MTTSASLPQPFVERISTIYPTRSESILQCFISPRKTAFRINTLKIERNVVLDTLQRLGIRFVEVSWYKNAFILENDKDVLVNSSLFADGQVYIQSLSSMLAVCTLDPKPDDYILDIASAPGSKTTLMAALMQNSGTIVANDVSPKRLHKLKQNLLLQGVTNTTVMNIPGERIWQKYPELFDKALVDVPCSMEGRFVTTDPKTYEDWTPKKGKILSSKQKHILRSAVSSVKVGGVIVYTTCTLSVEENETVIDWLLKKEGDKIAIEPVSFEGVETVAGITSYKQKQFDPRISQTLRILPSDIYEGFYIAKIRKHKSTIEKT